MMFCLLRPPILTSSFWACIFNICFSFMRSLVASSCSSFICSIDSVMDIVTAPMKRESITSAETMMKDTQKNGDRIWFFSGIWHHSFLLSGVHDSGDR